MLHERELIMQQFSRAKKHATSFPTKNQDTLHFKKTKLTYYKFHEEKLSYIQFYEEKENQHATSSTKKKLTYNNLHKDKTNLQ